MTFNSQGKAFNLLLDSTLSTENEKLEKQMEEKVKELAFLTSESANAQVAVAVSKLPPIPTFQYEKDQLRDHDYAVNTLSKISSYLTDQYVQDFEKYHPFILAK